MRRTIRIALCGLATWGVAGAHAQQTTTGDPNRPLPLSRSAQSSSEALQDDGWEIASDDDWTIASDLDAAAPGAADPRAQTASAPTGVRVASRLRQTPAAGSGIDADEIVASDYASSPSAASYSSGYSTAGGGCASCGGYGGCASCDAYGGYGVDCGIACPTACGNKFWAQVDYLYWWQKGSDLPPLVSTSPAGTAIGASGVLGSGFTDTATASVRVGREDLNRSPQSGGRVQFGVWLDDAETSMVGGHFFMMETHDGVSLNEAPNGGLILARPFYNTNPGVDAIDALITAHPSGAGGSINIRTETDVAGAGMFVRHAMHRSSFGRADLIVGYRFLRMDDLLLIEDSTTITGIGTGRPVAVGGIIDCYDLFEARNEFHGGDVGLAIDLGQPNKRLKASMVGKVAFGAMEQLMLIDGSTFVQAGPSQGTFVGSLLAQETNMGVHRQRDLAIIPEAQFNVGLRINNHLSANAGYTFLYVSRVQRAADAVDLNVDDRLLDDQPVAAAGPQFAFDTTDFWLQGMNFGLELTF